MVIDISSISMLELQALWHLSRKESHGYALMQDLSLNRSTPLTPGTLYPLLQRFETNKLIEVRSMEAREKKTYGITIEGQKLLDKLASEFVETFDGIYTKYHCTSCQHYLHDLKRESTSPESH